MLACGRPLSLLCVWWPGRPPPLAWRAPRDYASVVHVRIVRGVQMSGFYKGEKATAVAASLPYYLQNSQGQGQGQGRTSIDEHDAEQIQRAIVCLQRCRCLCRWCCVCVGSWLLGVVVKLCWWLLFRAGQRKRTSEKLSPCLLVALFFKRHDDDGPA